MAYRQEALTIYDETLKTPQKNWPREALMYSTGKEVTPRLVWDVPNY